MKPLTAEEYKALATKYRVRAGRCHRLDEIIAFINSGEKYAELTRFFGTEKIIAEQGSYGTSVWHLVKKKEILPNTISIHVLGDKIIAENLTVKET